MGNRLLLLTLLAIFGSIGQAQSQGALNDFPGSIPLTDDRGYAWDLVDERGNSLDEDEVALYNDPSTLDLEESNIWRSTPITRIPDVNLDTSGEELVFDSVEPSGISRLNFKTEKQAANGSREFFRLHMSRQAHNILVRAALLAKMGYRVPPIKWLKNVTLKFKTNNERNEFLQKHMNSTRMTALPDRWIKNIRRVTVNSEDQAGVTEWQVTKSTEDCMCLQLEDVVAYNSSTHLYNFPAGIVKQGFIERRRSFEALLLPFGMTYIDESINLFSWHLGQMVNNRLVVGYEERYQSEFFPTYSDAKWAARKMLGLSRSDWQDVAAFGSYPKAVEKLLVEKLLSRRNDLISLFDLKGAYKPIRVNPKVSHNTKWGKELENGKLNRQEYPGYAQKFALGDPESPLSNSELFSFGKAKIISNVIDYFVDEFNDNLAPRTDVEAKIAEKQLQVAVDQLIESVRQGQFVEVPFGTFTVPYANTKLLMSRDIVSGKIMGTENPIQIAHTFGWSVEAGALMFAYGLPTNVSANARANGYFTRTYSHLKPIKSISTALKEPYRNLFVPMIRSKMGKTFERIVNGEFDDLSTPLNIPEDLDPKEKEELKQARRERENDLIEFLSEFGEQFAPGESLIITDYVGGVGQIRAGYAIDQVINWDRSLRAQLEVKAGLEKIRRFHIFRESEKAIQIYDDNGNSARFEINLELDAAGQEIVQFGAFTTVGGTANTKFVRLNTNTERDETGELKNKQLLSNLKVFGNLLMTFDKNVFFEQREPTTVWHKFNQNGLQAEVLAWRWKKINTLDSIKISHMGEEKKFKRFERAWRSGVNWEKFAVDSVNTGISEFLDEVDFEIDTNTADDPGYTFKGQSRARKVKFEAVQSYSSKAKRDKLYNHYGRVEHRWRGWSAKPKKMRKILDELSAKYYMSKEDRIELFRPFDLRDTTKLELYSITLNMHLYMDAFNRMLNVSREELLSVFSKMAKRRKNRRNESDRNWARRMVNKYLCLRFKGPKRKNVLQKIGKILADKDPVCENVTSLHGAKQKGNLNKEARRWTDMIHHLEDNLDWPLLVELLRNPKNGRIGLYVEVTVEGFRRGDENVDPDSLLHTPYRANSFQGIGDLKVRGPLDFMQRNLKMSESEFFAYWIMERL